MLLLDITVERFDEKPAQIGSGDAEADTAGTTLLTVMALVTVLPQLV